MYSIQESDPHRYTEIYVNRLTRVYAPKFNLISFVTKSDEQAGLYLVLKNNAKQSHSKDMMVYYGSM